MKKKLVAKKSVPPVHDPRTVSGGGKPFWDLFEHGVTQGFIETLFNCPRKAHLKYREGIEGKGFSYALKFGNVVHGALDHVYTTYRDTKDSTLAIASYPAILEADEFITRQEYAENGGLSEIEAKLEEIYALAEVILLHYFARYEQEDFNGGIAWEGLEEVFNYPYTIKLGDGREVQIPVRGKIDGRYRAGSKRRKWIVDHKTKGQISTNMLLDRLSMDLQVNLYLLIDWKQTGEIPAGCLYNVIRRPQLQRKAQEDTQTFATRVYEDIGKRPDFYFHRYEVPVQKSDLEQFERELYSMLRLAYAWYRGSFEPFRLGSSCENKYGACEYLALCGRGDKFGYRRRQHVFPELVQIETG